MLGAGVGRQADSWCGGDCTRMRGCGMLEAEREREEKLRSESQLGTGKREERPNLVIASVGTRIM